MALSLRQKISFLLLTLFTAGFFSACSGAKGPSGEFSCEPGSATEGTAIRCLVSKNFSTDCTVFFGQIPIDVLFHEDTQEVEFIVPSELPGERAISFQCGDNALTVLTNSFMLQELTPDPNENEGCLEDADCPTGQVCEGRACVVPGEEDTCVSDSDCLFYQECRNDVCVDREDPSEVCIDNNDCLDDEICDNGFCRLSTGGPIPDCEFDSDCQVGEVCQAGTCVARSARCPTDFQCLSNETCDTATGRCVANPTACSADTDCDQSAGEVCQNGQCVSSTPDCFVDSDCQVGETCQSGSCVARSARCPTDFQCQTGEVCNASGQCVPQTSAGCFSDSDCAATEECQSGACVPRPARCPIDFQCLTNETCNNGICVPTNVVDSDGDGFGDLVDACPLVSGVPPDGCPSAQPTDTDNDGVPDASDQCPNTSGPASNNGCPPATTTDTDGDGVRDSSDACPTVFGSRANGCPMAATIHEFSLRTPDAQFNPRISTYKIDWRISGVKKAYLWGNIFNRQIGDGPTILIQNNQIIPHDSCGLTNGRYLLTEAGGNDWNTVQLNLPAQEEIKELSSGIRCGSRANPDLNDSCYQPARPSAGIGNAVANHIPTTVTSPRSLQRRPNLPFQSSSPTLRPGVNTNNIGLNPNGNPLTPGLSSQVSQDANIVPDCRINLEYPNSNQVILEDNDQIYTRSFVKEGHVCLVVQGEDDQWKVACADPAAPTPQIVFDSISGNSEKAKIESDQYALRFAFDYTGAVAAPQVTRRDSPMASPVACTSSSVGPTNDGAGRYEGVCLLSKTGDLKTFIDVNLSGVGAENGLVKNVQVDVGAPNLEFNYWGGHKSINCDELLPADDCRGDLDFQWKVSREYSVIETSTNEFIAGGTTPWIESIVFARGNNPSTTTPITSTIVTSIQEEGYQKISSRRNYDSNRWTLIGMDFGGRIFSTQELTWGYPMEFRMFNAVIEPSGGGDGCYANSFDSCGDFLDGNCGECVDTGNAHMNIAVQWAGKNIKAIHSTCIQLSPGPSHISSSENPYGPKAGLLRATLNTGSYFGKKTCDFEATSYSGEKIYWNSVVWECACDMQGWSAPAGFKTNAVPENMSPGSQGSTPARSRTDLYVLGQGYISSSSATSTGGSGLSAGSGNRRNK